MNNPLEGIAYVVRGFVSRPFSIDLRAGETVALFGPIVGHATPLFNALAGRDREEIGGADVVAHQVTGTTPKVALVSPDADRSADSARRGQERLVEAAAARPDVLLIDGLLDHDDVAIVAEHWKTLDAARDCGIVVLATTLAEAAFRCDRVVLSEWSADELRSEIVRIQALVHSLVGELLEMLSAGSPARGAVTAARVKRLAAAARSLVGEMWRQAGTQDEVILARRFATEVAAEALSDRVLDALIAGGKTTA